MPIESNMSSFLRTMERAARAMEGAPEEIAQEVAYEIHGKAIEKASGPNWKAEVNKERKQNQKRKGKKFRLRYFEAFFKYDSTPERFGKLNYPVPVITGTFRRAHKVERVAKGVYRIYGDQNVANYFSYVHDGTSKMEARPTIDDAANEVIKSRRGIEITRDIIRRRLREARGI